MDEYMDEFIGYDSLTDTNWFDSIGYDLMTTDTNVLPPVPLVPISNICFLSNTIIQTDQGNIPIGKINPKIHTIYGKKIVAVVKTICLDKHLICFEKNVLGMNYPNRQIIISKEHKILCNGRMIQAGKVRGGKKILYKGEILYNILMERYEKIKACNLTCETLHP